MKMLLKVQNGGRKKLRTGEIKCAKTTARHTIQSLICSRIKMGETSQEKLGQLRVRQISNVITTISIDFCRSNSFLSFFFFAFTYLLKCISLKEKDIVECSF